MSPLYECDRAPELVKAALSGKQRGCSRKLVKHWPRQCSSANQMANQASWSRQHYTTHQAAAQVSWSRHPAAEHTNCSSKLVNNMLQSTPNSRSKGCSSKLLVNTHYGCKAHQTPAQAKQSGQDSTAAERIKLLLK